MPPEVGKEGRYYLFFTFDVLSEAHGGGDVLVFAARLFLLHIIVAGHVARRANLFLLLPLFVAWGQLFGEGKHGEDDQEHGYGTEEKAAPPGKKKQMRCINDRTGNRFKGCKTDAHVYLPVANKAGVTLVDVDDSFGVDVEADEDASQQVASCRSQGSHHIHDG